MVDIKDFEFVTRRKRGMATITVYASGFVTISGTVGKTLDKTIDFAISKDGKRVMVKNGYVFKTTPNGRLETTSRTFSSKKISARLDALGILFPAYYHCEQQGDYWVGTLEECEQGQM